MNYYLQTHRDKLRKRRRQAAIKRHLAEQGLEVVGEMTRPPSEEKGASAEPSLIVRPVELPPAKEYDSSNWEEGAACADWSKVDPETFYLSDKASLKLAKKVCSGCVVQEHCLDYAISHGEDFGIWGGLTEQERRRTWKKRAAGGVRRHDK